MNFITIFDQWDKQLMLWLNYNGTVFTDAFWYNYSGKVAWIAAALAILYCFIRNKGGWRESLLVILLFVVMATLCDQISSSLIKPWAMRLRPSHNEEIQNLLFYVNNYHGGRYGFISSHAANSLGVATFLWCFFKGRFFRFTIAFWAICNCYSRIYLGVHYPGDILGGMILGISMGLLCYALYLPLHRWLEWKYSTIPSRYIYKREPWILTLAIWATIIVLLVIAAVKACLALYS